MVENKGQPEQPLGQKVVTKWAIGLVKSKEFYFTRYSTPQLTFEKSPDMAMKFDTKKECMESLRLLSKKLDKGRLFPTQLRITVPIFGKTGKVKN